MTATIATLDRDRAAVPLPALIPTFIPTFIPSFIPSFITALIPTLIPAFVLTCQLDPERSAL